ncbi:isochorismatase family protein [Amycolatopsis alba]|uniref:2,3-dihydro-2,3-dihydroxybenzoate synthetase n=1 Tax=Amycolatopsis alba DSM 44262 TaxID=1125972 RepID=A0A229S2F2_AMYAL|nr:isochorismatase family protein [Amycolatopsis alba]OXM53097.1 2,3-dihydro-2,3-dihydroxybenzoate synthetase [Amycolatopsis alba DSM 44262]
MAIPPIDAYPLPSPAELTANRVHWRLDTTRCALLVHDMQKYFIDAFDRTTEPASALIENIRLIREICRQNGIPVIYTAQPGNQHPSRRGILADFWGTGLVSGRDEEIVDDLAPNEVDIFVTKWRYSAFQRTDLAQLLNRHGRDQLIITGVYAHMGCMLSAAEAFMNDIEPFMISDATADFSRAEHLGALDYVAKRCGTVLPTDRVITSLIERSAA